MKVFTKRLADGTILMGTVGGGVAPVQLDMVVPVTAWLSPEWETWPQHIREPIKRALDVAERENQMGFQIVEARCEPDWDVPGTVEGHPSRYTLHVVALSHIPVQH
jgi:hypothetical protein